MFCNIAKIRSVPQTTHVRFTPNPFSRSYRHIKTNIRKTNKSKTCLIAKTMSRLSCMLTREKKTKFKLNKNETR